jgi:hypothetical protein
VKIISTKWFMHISHLISVSIFLENFMQRLLQINCRYFFYFFLLICYLCILMYNIPTRIFTDLYLKSKRQHFRVFIYKSNLYFFCQFYNYMYTCYLEIIKWTKILGQENKQDWIHFLFLDERRKVKGKLKSKFNRIFVHFIISK